MLQGRILRVQGTESTLFWVRSAVNGTIFITLLLVREHSLLKVGHCLHIALREELEDASVQQEVLNVEDVFVVVRVGLETLAVLNILHGLILEVDCQ